MNEDGDPRENAFVESFNKTVKYEEAYLSENFSCLLLHFALGVFLGQLAYIFTNGNI